MNFLSFLRKHTWAISFIVIAIAFLYKDLPNTFFQQDEWWTFGSFISRLSDGIVKAAWYRLIQGGRIHTVPLSDFLFGAEFQAFGTNFAPYAIVSVGLHIVNTVIVFWFSMLLLSSAWLSFLVALLFGVNSIGHQAVSWVSASINTQGATLFSLISLIALVSYLKNERAKSSLFYLYGGAAIVALLFKEVLLAFFVAPIIVALLANRRSSILFKKLVLLSAIFLGSYALLRIILFGISEPVVLGLTEVQNQAPLPVIFFRLLLLPFRVLPQTILSASLLLSLARNLTSLAYPHFVGSDSVANPYFTEGPAFDLVTMVFTLIGLGITFIVYQGYQQQKELGKALLISLGFIVAAAFPIVFITGRAGYISIIEPRHLYAATIGGSLWFILAINFLAKKLRLNFLAVLTMVPLLIFHIRSVQADIDKLVLLGKLRRSFLETIMAAYPRLPENVVFYVESDSAYYGMPIEETNLPIQSGFGRMLMVWYQKGERLPECLYEGVFLHDLIAEDYKTCEGRGFGYARKYQTLLRILQENTLDADTVIGYSWKGKTEEFRDITPELRKRISKDLEVSNL